MKHTYYFRDNKGNTMGVYELVPGDTLKAVEHTLYSTDRFGTYYRAAGTYAYELKDHLGNVRATIERWTVDETAQQSPYPALSFMADYYPFGWMMPDRKQLTYRYGYNDQELDEETGWYTFKFRAYDARIARFHRVDPIKTQYPRWSPYHFAGNSPVRYSDLEGAERSDRITFFGYDIEGMFWRISATEAYDNSFRKPIQENVEPVGRTFYETITTYYVFLRTFKLGLRIGNAESIEEVAEIQLQNLESLSPPASALNRIGPSIKTGAGSRSYSKPIREYHRTYAVKLAWKEEKHMVETTGRGTRDWSAAEMQELMETGKVSGYVGHHINSVKKFPELQGEPNNIKFVPKDQHLLEHGRNWQNPTSGPLLNRNENYAHDE